MVTELSTHCGQQDTNGEIMKNIITVLGTILISLGFILMIVGQLYIILKIGKIDFLRGFSAFIPLILLYYIFRGQVPYHKSRRAFITGLIMIIVGSVILQSFPVTTPGYSASKNQDWKLYFTDEAFSYFYDLRNLTRQSHNVVKINEKWVVNGDKGRESYLRNSAEIGFPLKGYEKFKESQFLTEINCSDKKSRILSATDYAENGNILRSESRLPNQAKWKDIIPESIGEQLYRAVCK